MHGHGMDKENLSVRHQMNVMRSRMMETASLDEHNIPIFLYQILPPPPTTLHGTLDLPPLGVLILAHPPGCRYAQQLRLKPRDGLLEILPNFFKALLAGGVGPFVY